MAEQLSTSQIRDLRDAAERVEKANKAMEVAFGRGWMDARCEQITANTKYGDAADPTTVKALCDEMLRIREAVERLQKQELGRKD